MSLPLKTHLSLIVFTLALVSFISVALFKKSLNTTWPYLSTIENARRQLKLSQSQKAIYFFSSVEGISLRPGKNSEELEALLHSSKIFGKKISIYDETQNTGGFQVNRIIFELVDNPQPYYEQKYPNEVEPSVSFGLARYDDQTLHISIALSKNTFQQMNSQELTWMVFTRAREILKIWEYRERFASMSEFVVQKQEDDALSQAEATKVMTEEGLEAFPVVVLKANP